MPKFRNKSKVRICFKVPGRKGMTFVEGSEVVSLTDQEVLDMKADKYLLDSYLEPLANEEEVV